MDRTTANESNEAAVTQVEVDSPDHHKQTQLNFQRFVQRLRLEEKLNRRGFRVLHYYATMFLFVITLVTYDSIISITDVHRSLAQRFDVARLGKIKDVDSVMDYLDFFIGQTYSMASAMIDVNTFDSIDPARCFDPRVTDICQLRYWSVPDHDPSAPNYINRTEMIDMSLGRLGRHPERPVVLDSRMDFQTPMVVPVAPLVWQTRAKRVPCSGFGNVYNDEILGAGRCPLDSDCPEGTAVSSFAKGTSGQRIYLTYHEPAFSCVDHTTADTDVFYDKSWYPGASWNDLKVGRQIASQNIGGTDVFPKFVSNIAYLQAPIKLEVGGQKLTEDSDMWGEASVSKNPRRAQWVEEYIATASDARKNTFVTLETKALVAIAVVVVPQGEKMPDISTIAMAKFEFSPYGRIIADMDFLSTSETSLSWQVTAGIFWFIASTSVIDNFQRHVRHWYDPMITSPKILRISDVVLPLAAMIHAIIVFHVDISPPHVPEEFKTAFSGNSERHHYVVIGHIIEYAEVHVHLRVVGFFICVLFVFRAIMQLELHPKFALLLNAVHRCQGDLWHIFLACIPIFIVMGFQAFWMFAIDHRSQGFESLFSTFRTTLTYVMPGIPTNFSSQNTLMFVIWGFVGLFVLRLFYLVTIASIVKAFMGAKDAVSQDVVQDAIQNDAVDAFKMSFYRAKHNWPRPQKILSVLNPGMEQRLKKGASSVPNAVTPEELAQKIPGLLVEQAALMLNHYAAKLSDEDGNSALEETNPKLRFGEGSFEGQGERQTASQSADAGGGLIETSLSVDLRKVLADAGVTNEVLQWLADNGIRSVIAFADLAETKDQIVDVVGRPAGLDPSNSLQTQPLKTAWRHAEAIAKAQLDDVAHGRSDVSV